MKKSPYDPKNAQHHVGFCIENDYRWPFPTFFKRPEDLLGLRIKTIEEYYPESDWEDMEMSPELKEMINKINALVKETRQAAGEQDMKTYQNNYERLEELKEDVPYDVEIVMNEFREAGYFKEKVDLSTETKK